MLGILIAGAVLLAVAVVVPAAVVPLPPALTSLIGFAGLVLVMAGGFGRYYARQDRRRQEILATGVPGAARVVAARRTESLRKQTALYLQLEVWLPGRAPYQASASRTVPSGTAGAIRAGDTVPVRVDPGRRYDIELEIDTVPVATLEIIPALPADLDWMPRDELLVNVRRLGAPGRAMLDEVTLIGEEQDLLVYRLSPRIRLDNDQPVRLTTLVVLVPPAHADDVVAGVTVPVRVARRASGGIVVAWEWGHR